MHNRNTIVIYEIYFASKDFFTLFNKPSSLKNRVMSRTFNVTVFSYVLIIAQYPAMHVIIFDMRAYNWIFLYVS